MLLAKRPFQRLLLRSWALSHPGPSRLPLKPPSRSPLFRPFHPSSRSLEKNESHHPEEKPLLYPAPPTNQHSDLKSFLAYAERSGLDPASTVYVGTRYEYTVASALSRYGIFLRRVGGVSDQGIDLLGTWNLPLASSSSPPSAAPTPAPSAAPSAAPRQQQSQAQSPPLKVLLQCKAGAQRIGPSLVRELEGSFAGAPVGWRGSRVLALLVSERTATKGVRDSLGRSTWPMGFISCTRDGVVQQMLWNRRAEQEGLEGVGVGMRYSAGDGPQIALTHNGKPLPLLDAVS